MPIDQALPRARRARAPENCNPRAAAQEEPARATAMTVIAMLIATGIASGHRRRIAVFSPRRTMPTRSSKTIAAIPLSANWNSTR